MSFKEITQKWLKSSLQDPFIKILAQNSNLTKTQLETLLIDVLAESIAQKHLGYQEKSELRLSTVSRGAFNRTLKQARKNIIRSIYTILLLGYIGIFEDASLSPYLEIANKLQGYMDAYNELRGKDDTKDERISIMSKLREELEIALQQLSKPKAFSTRV